MKFIDQTTVRVVGGSGGSGAVSWRREKFLPRGGPDGGDGGDGGAVIFVAASGLNTLLECALNPIIKAKSGQPGAENQKNGARGSDVIRRVPLGTQVLYDGTLVADLSVEGAQWIAAKGGRGGKGNTHFKSSTNRAPDRAQPGRAGDDRELTLVLKSVADIGLVGLPNVGKSSLVSALSEAHPLVADYPFTTIQPSLGVVSVDKDRRFVIADIPGLVEGAHSGKGLGHQFLKHIERTKALLFVVDCSQDERIQQSLTELGETKDDLLLLVAEEQIELLKNELLSFNDELLDRPHVVTFSKSDIALQQRAFELFSAQHPEIEILAFSSHANIGLQALKERSFELVSQLQTSPQND